MNELVTVTRWNSGALKNLLQSFVFGLGFWALATAAVTPFWIPVTQSDSVSPLMVRGSEVNLADTNILGEFLVPTVTSTPHNPATNSWAEFTAVIPKHGRYYLWSRMRAPTGLPESFGVVVVGAKTNLPINLLIGGGSVTNREWHWCRASKTGENDSGANGSRLILEPGKWTFRIFPRQASATVYGPGNWREAELTLNPRLNLLCLTDDPEFIPTDRAAQLGLGLGDHIPILPRVRPTMLRLLPPNHSAQESRKPLPEWMRCPRWFTKDSWRDELATRQRGDIATLVRNVAANGADVIRLSCFWGGEAYFQSRVAPHPPGLGDLDYLQEALDESAHSGLKVIVYMNPNALYLEHPLLSDCAVRGPDGEVSPQPTYGGGFFANTRYVCINNPRYQEFLHDVITEIFTRYKPAGLYVDGLTPHLCFCKFCQAKWRDTFHEEMPVTKLSQIIGTWSVWSEMGRDPAPVGDIEENPDARHLTDLMLRSLVTVTHQVSRAVKEIKPDAITAFHSHPKPGTDADYDATLTEVYLTKPWVHTAWRSGELAGYSSVYRVPVLFNIYPHAHCTAAEARYLAVQGLANGAYPNFWTVLGMKPIYDYMARCAEYLDFDRTMPEKFLALPRDLVASETQRKAALPAEVNYGQLDRFLAPYVGAYSALMRSGLPVVTLNRPHFEDELSGFKVLVLANVALMSDAQAEAVRQFVREGGGLIAAHETSLLDEAGRRRTNFALADLFGIRYRRMVPGSSRSLAIGKENPITRGITVASAFRHTEPVVEVESVGAESVGTFSPEAGKSDAPPAILTHTYGHGRVVYFSGRFDAMQCEQLSPTIEALFNNAVRWVAPEELPVEVSSSGIIGVTLFQQPHRRIVHLVNHQRDSQLRTDSFSPISNVQLNISVPGNVQIGKVHRLWENRDVPFSVNAQHVKVDVGMLGEYEAVAVEW